MGVTFASSGDLAADRRYGYARDLLKEGDAEAAADLFRQTLELAPGWAPAWFGLGEALERSGAASEAVEAYRRALALAPNDALGATPRLARLGAGDAAMTNAYVAALFDEYAPRFDTHLTEALAYRGPQVILSALDEAAPGRRFGDAMDLGCGTGLMAAAIVNRVGAIDGVDLSGAMVAKAQARGLYRTLAVGEMAALLAEAGGGRYDLVLAADVLVYVGDLEPLFFAVHAALSPEGLFAFTVQALAEGDGFAVGPDLRLHHSPSYLRRIAAGARLEPLYLAACVLRTDGGHPVAGYAAVMRKADG